jgi:hypothetical protein
MNNTDVHVFGPVLVSASTFGRKMEQIIRDGDEDQFAKGQSSRDLRVGSDAAELKDGLKALRNRPSPMP